MPSDHRDDHRDDPRSHPPDEDPSTLVPEPFKVDAAAVDLAAAAARAAFRRTSAALRQRPRQHSPALDPILIAAEPLKTP